MANIRSFFFQPKKDIFAVSRSGDVKLMELILAEKPDVNQRDENGETPLFIAAENGHLSVIEALLRAGANVDLASTDPHDRKYNTKSATPLVIASLKGHQEVVKTLLSAGANVNTISLTGHTPLIIAAVYDRVEVVKLLIAAGANIHFISKNGNTALLWVVKHSRVKLAKILLEAGANANVVGSQIDLVHGYHYKEVPLSVAAQNNHEEMIKMLIEANADVSLAYGMLGFQGRTNIQGVLNALEVAKQKRKALVIKSEALRRDPSTYFSILPYDILKFFVFPMVRDARDTQNTIEPSSECRIM